MESSAKRMGAIMSAVDRAELSSEANALFAQISALREEIIVAWSERGVVLSRFEQERFHQEIATTCKLLADLTLTR